MARVLAFFRTAWLAYFGLYTWLDRRYFLILKVLQPLAEMTFFVYLGTCFGGRQPSYYLVGNALRLASWSTVTGLVIMVRQDRFLQTLKYLVGAPVAKSWVFAGRAVLAAADALLVVTMGFIFGWLGLGLGAPPAALPGLAAAIAAACLSLAGFGLAVASLGLAFRDVNIFVNSAYALFFVCAGVNVPVECLPSALAAVSWWLPLTRAVQAARGALAGAPLGGLGRLLAAELAVGLAYFLAGCLLFALMERRARIAGDVEEM